MENVSGEVFYNCFNQAMSLPWGQFFLKSAQFPTCFWGFPWGCPSGQLLWKTNDKCIIELNLIIIELVSKVWTIINQYTVKYT